MQKSIISTIALVAGLSAMPGVLAQNGYGDPSQGQYGQQPYPYQQPQGYGGQPMYAQPNQQYQPMPPMPMYPPNYGGRPPQQAQAAAPKSNMNVAQWFHHYDEIRHEAQMNPMEKQRADGLMSKGLSILMPGTEKQATKMLLASLAVRYQKAAQQLGSLPIIKQTEQLHRGYYEYFTTAAGLFNDYVRVQDNLLVTDAATGQPVASSLLQRKQMLEALEHQCKAVDAQTRMALGVPPYPY